MNEWAVRKQMLLDLGATKEQLHQEEIAHEQQILDLKWQQWKKQNDINGLIGNMVDGLSSGAGSAFTGLINGTQSLARITPPTLVVRSYLLWSAGLSNGR
ncbi:Uncharacterised protein [Escherichia coli]|nr:Uncharacterised protein [Escherichia coli]